jgi:hypothetical protein
LDTLNKAVVEDENGGDKVKAKRPSLARPRAYGFLGIEVNVIEHLPAPYRLVRYSIAPDQPEVKNVEQDFTLLFYNHSEDSEDGAEHDLDRQTPLRIGVIFGQG